MSFSLYFSRTLLTIFTFVIWEKFSRTQLTFHGQFSSFFHGRKKNFTYRNPKIVENFHGRDFDFHGKKNAGLHYGRENREPRMFAAPQAREKNNREKTGSSEATSQEQKS